MWLPIKELNIKMKHNSQIQSGSCSGRNKTNVITPLTDTNHKYLKSTTSDLGTTQEADPRN